MSRTELLAAAANGASLNEFSTSDESQWLVDLLASAFDGLILLPFALFFVWGIRRLNLNHWSVVTALLATVFALILSSLMHEYIAPIFIYSDKMLELFGLGRFMYLAVPAILVCFAGALVIAWKCVPREPINTNTF